MNKIDSILFKIKRIEYAMLELFWNVLCPFSFALFRNELIEEDWGYFVDLEE
jgi:hypothetical protein